MALSDGALTAAAPGEDGALLAQPFRDGVFEDCGIAGGHRGRALHGGEAGRGSQWREGADRGAPGFRAGQFPRPAPRNGEGCRDAGLARWAAECPSAAAGEFCPRADGALHHGGRYVRRVGRLCRRPGVHRMEPRPTRQRLLHVQLCAGRARYGGQGVHLSNLCRWRKNDCRTIRRFRHAGWHRPDHRGRAASGDRPAAGDQAVSLLRQRDRRPGPAADQRA